MCYFVEGHFRGNNLAAESHHAALQPDEPIQSTKFCPQMVEFGQMYPNKC